MVAKDVHLFPLALRLSLHTIACGTVLFFMFGGYMYYGSVPHARTTVLTYLMKTLMLIASINAIWFNLATCFLDFPDLVDPIFLEYPQAVCLLFRAELYVGLLLKVTILVLTFRLGLTVNSLEFHGINHEKIYKIALAILILMTTLENVLIYLSYQTLCPNMKILQLLSNAHGITIPDQELKNAHGPPLLAIQCILVCIPEGLRKYLQHRSMGNEQRIFAVSGRVVDINTVQDIPGSSNEQVQDDESQMKNNSISIRTKPQELLSPKRLKQNKVGQVWIDNNKDTTTSDNNNGAQADDQTNKEKEDKSIEIKTGITIYFIALMSTFPLGRLPTI